MNDKLLPLETFIEKTKEEGKIPDKLYFCKAGIQVFLLAKFLASFSGCQPSLA